MTAILSLASLSSVITSSSRGPTVRLCLPPLEKTRPLMKLLRLPKRLRASSAIRMMAKTIHPRPRRGGGVDAGATITGGGGCRGGGEVVGGGVEIGGGDALSSIACGQ